MIISIIVAMDNHRGIGYKGKIPWNIPSDMKRFRKLTMNHHILMGRKTYLSIGRPLPGRVNIVISRDNNFSAPGCIVFNTIDYAIHYAREAGENELFVIGGAEIYRKVLPFTDKLYITKVKAEYLVDKKFPNIKVYEWTLLEGTITHAGEIDDHDTCFQVYERKL